MEKIIFFGLVIPILGFVLYLGGMAIMNGFNAKKTNKIEENINDQVIQNSSSDENKLSDEIERLNNYAFFSYNFVEQNDSTLVYAKNLKAEKTTLDSLEFLKNAFYHFYCLRKINGYNLSFQSFEMGDFRKLTIDQMLTSAKYSY